jgi:tetratricopeptide (TPR) repeat protein
MKRYTLLVLAGILALYVYIQCESYAVTGMKVYMNTNNVDEGIAVLEQRVKEVPTDAAARYYLGQLYQNKYNNKNSADKSALDRSLTQYELSLKYSSQFEKQIDGSLRNLYITLCTNGSNFLKTANNESDSLRRFTAFQKSYSEYEYAGRLKSYSRSLELDNKYFEGMIVSQFGMGNDEKSTELSKQLLTKEPKNMNALIRVAESSFNRAERVKTAGKIDTSSYKDAINYWSKLIEYYPEKLSEVIDALGVSYENIGEYNKALELYQEVLKKDPNNKEMIIASGLIMYRMHNIKGAVEMFNQALKRYPDDTQLYKLIAFPLWEEMSGKINANIEPTKGEIDTLLPYMEKVVQIDSNSVAGWSALSVMYLKLNVSYNDSSAGDKIKHAFLKYTQLTASASEQEFYYTVQVIATSNRIEAENVQKNLSLLNIPEVTLLQENNLWKVNAGKYKDQNDAEMMRNRLKEMGYNDSSVVKQKRFSPY